MLQQTAARLEHRMVVYLFFPQTISSQPKRANGVRMPNQMVLLMGLQLQRCSKFAQGRYQLLSLSLDVMSLRRSMQSSLGLSRKRWHYFYILSYPSSRKQIQADYCPCEYTTSFFLRLWADIQLMIYSMISLSRQEKKGWLVRIFDSFYSLSQKAWLSQKITFFTSTLRITVGQRAMIVCGCTRLKHLVLSAKLYPFQKTSKYCVSQVVQYFWWLRWLYSLNDENLLVNLLIFLDSFLEAFMSNSYTSLWLMCSIISLQF